MRWINSVCQQLMVSSRTCYCRTSCLLHGNQNVSISWQPWDCHTAALFSQRLPEVCCQTDRFWGSLLAVQHHHQQRFYLLLSSIVSLKKVLLLEDVLIYINAREFCCLALLLFYFVSSHLPGIHLCIIMDLQTPKKTLGRKGHGLGAWLTAAALTQLFVISPFKNRAPKHNWPVSHTCFHR